jgi:hypothetical protein
MFPFFPVSRRSRLPSPSLATPPPALLAMASTEVAYEKAVHKTHLSLVVLSMENRSCADDGFFFVLVIFLCH